MNKYFYKPASSILQIEENLFIIRETTGSIYQLTKEAFIVYSLLEGKANYNTIKERAKQVLPISQRKLESIIDSLIKNEIILISEFPRNSPFRYGPILKSILNDKFEKPRVVNIGSVTFAVSTNCPYRCKGCYISKKNEKYTIKDEVLERTIKSISEMGALYIALSGGEPTFLEEDLRIIEKLSQMAKQHGIPERILLTTGFNLPQCLERLLDSGINKFQISLDGFKDYNDQYKGFEGSFERALDAIKFLQNKEVPYLVNTVVTKQNINEIPRFIDFLVDLDVREIRLTRVLTKDLSLRLSIRDAKFLKNIVEEKRKEFSHLIIKSSYDNIGATKLVNCVAGFTYAHIKNNGDVLPCAFLDGYVAGNINKKDFRDIWTHSKILEEMRTPKEAPDMCISCSDRNFCIQECRANLEYILGKPLNLSLCPHNR